MDKRLEKRYQIQVQAHLKTNQRLAPASKSTDSLGSSFAATQAAWRFYANKKTTLSCLSQPLLEATTRGIENCCDEYALVIHDWSSVNYLTHKSKKDKKILHNEYEQGYELQSSLVVSDRNGMPVGVFAQNLTTIDGVLSSYRDEGLHVEQSHLQELAERVQWIEKQEVSKPVVHIVDREGDALEWLRATPKSHWLIRCKQNSTVDFNGRRYRLDELAQELTYSQEAVEIEYKGKAAGLTFAQANVVLSRAAKPKRLKNQKVKIIEGEALAAQFVVTRLIDDQQNVLAQWYLLSNVPDISPQTIATWYYWRWQIECFFKLLKQQGLQLEEWQQETALAVAKRLLVASQACVLVWQLQHENTPQANETKTFLVRLTQRQMKKNRPVTPSALMEGLWLFLMMMEVFDNYSAQQLAQFKQVASAFWATS